MSCGPSTLDINGMATCVVTGALAGTYSATASYGGDIIYGVSSGSDSASVARATPSAPTITNLPTAATFGGTGFTASVSTSGDGTKSVTSNSSGVCTVGGDRLSVTCAGAGILLTAHVAAGANFTAADGSAQTFSVGRATPTTPTITNLPSTATFPGTGFAASVGTAGDSTTSVTSNSPFICNVGADAAKCYLHE